MSSHSSPRQGLPPAAPDPLPIDVVDNHVHLDIGRDGADPLDVSEADARARGVGVGRLGQAHQVRSRWDVDWDSVGEVPEQPDG